MNQNNNTFINNSSNNNVANEGAVTSQGVTGQTVPVQAGSHGQSNASDASVSATNSNIMLCPRCGSEMKKDARYCMKCGNLNYAHPDNESMKQYAWQSIKQGNFIAGANVNNKQGLSMNKMSSVSNVNPFKVCFITNLCLSLLPTVVLVLIAIFTSNVSNENTYLAPIIVSVVLSIIGFILSYSVQAVYIKAGEPWWGYFIPLYNNYILYKIALSSGWIFLTLFIPVVGVIVSLVMWYNLGKKFYKNGWLTLFFPFIMIPIIAFDKNCEYSMLAKSTTVASVRVDASGKTNTERAYGRKKFILTVIIMVIIAAVLYFTWPYLQPLLEKFYEFFMEQLEFFK